MGKMGGACEGYAPALRRGAPAGLDCLENPRTAFSWVFGLFGAGSSSGILLSRHLNKSTFAPKSLDYVSLFLLLKIYLQGVLDRQRSPD